jgi:glycosyltransferase involved in cell wall biosynthesis
MRIMMFIGSLQVGGAERKHASLAALFAERGHDVTFVTLDAGRDAPEIRSLLGDIPCRAVLAKPRPYPLRLMQLRGAWRPLRRMLIELQPDVVYAVLDWANWLAVRAATAVEGGPSVVIGVGSGSAPARWPRRIADDLLAKSRAAEGLIADSSVGMETSHARGIYARDERVIHGGIDANYFHPEPVAAAHIRREFNLSADGVLVGHVGRLHPVKDHSLLLAAFATMPRSARLLCVGSGPRAYASKLRRLAASLGVADRVTWWQRHEYLPAVYSAIDILALPSHSEGCPNVVMEAMACGTPCVVAAVGAAPKIVGETGVVVHDRQPASLAAAIANIPQGPSCRARIVAEFTIDRCVDQTLAFLQEIAGRAKTPH